jgi:hypothetical protein
VAIKRICPPTAKARWFPCQEDHNLIMESIKKYVSIYKYKHKDAIRLGGIWKNIKITDEDIKENREDLLKKIEDKW